MLGFIKRMLGSAGGKPRGPLDDFWYAPIGPMSGAGIAVTPDTALQLTSLTDCLDILASDVAKLPVVFFRRKSDGSKERLDQHPAAQVMSNPNGRDTSFDFRAQMQWDLGFFRNAYAEIRPGPRGFASELIPLPARNMRVVAAPGGAIVYEYTDPRRPGWTRKLREDQIWHLRKLPLRDDRLAGRPVYETHSEVIGAALACYDYAARFFRNDAKTGGIVKAPAGFTFKTDEDRTRWLAAWQAGAVGGNRHRDRLLEFGFDYERIAATNDESQFIETKRNYDLAVTRIWRMPPHKVGMLERATNNNIEQQALEYVMDTLLTWLVLWEQRISADLILEEDVFAEFNVAGLLRGDILARYQAFSLARNWGWLSVNDIRRLENMDPIADGDEYLRPLNTVPIGDEFGGSKPAPAREGASDPKKLNGHAKEEASGHA